MEYGLIGENLSHSFSKFIHSEFNLYNYNLYYYKIYKFDYITDGCYCKYRNRQQL